MTTKKEYKVLTVTGRNGDLQQHLNKLANSGWELVNLREPITRHSPHGPPLLEWTLVWSQDVETQPVLLTETDDKGEKNAE
jgi:hypothetical protein